MKKTLVATILFILTSYVTAQTLIPRSVSGDKGKYYLIKKSKAGNIISTLHKRVGVDTIGYTSAKVNCKTRQIQDVGYSDISANAIKNNYSGWYDLVEGSSKYDLYMFVCKK